LGEKPFQTDENQQGDRRTKRWKRRSKKGCERGQYRKWRDRAATLRRHRDRRSGVRPRKPEKKVLRAESGESEGRKKRTGSVGNTISLVPRAEKNSAVSSTIHIAEEGDMWASRAHENVRGKVFDGESTP